MTSKKNDNAITERIQSLSIHVDGLIFRHTRDVSFSEANYIATEVGEMLLDKHRERKQEEPF